MEWNTMESAPRDGTPILGFWLPDGVSPSRVTVRNYGLTIFEGGSWRDTEQRDEEYGEPKFWMPLPPPPLPKEPA